MKKVTAGAVALALTGVGSVALAGPGSTQTTDDIPGLPGTLYDAEISGGFQGVFELDNPGFSRPTVSNGDNTCTVGDGQVAAAVAIEIWHLEENEDPSLLDSGYILSDAEFWGDDPAQFFEEGELDGWTIDGFPTPVGKTLGNFTTSYDPPEVNGEQVFVGHCIVVGEDDVMEGSAAELPRADEAFVGSYPVTGAADPGGDDGPPATDPPTTTTAPPAEDDDLTIPPPATPVTGEPSFTG